MINGRHLSGSTRLGCPFMIMIRLNVHVALSVPASTYGLFAHRPSPPVNGHLPPLPPSARDPPLPAGQTPFRTYQASARQPQIYRVHNGSLSLTSHQEQDCCL